MNWQQYFGFESAYESQADAIETAIETVSDNGYLAMEGPCGTGKTMAALTAAATLCRETDQFETVFVATPVKQQRQQFIADLRQLNRGLESPLSGVALVGKADLCPYEREGTFPAEAAVHDRCEELRETTASLVQEDSDSDTATSASRSLDESDTDVPEPAAQLTAGSSDADQWWDTDRARELVATAERDLDAAQQSATATTSQPLETAGATAPYGSAQPAAPESMTSGESTPLYCPFEADYYARNKGSPIGFEAGVDHVVSTAELLPATVESGTCPHRSMSVLLEHAEVVIGNYNHLFDSQSRNLTAPILDDRTLVIIDEAHQIEDRVRDLVSETIGRVSIKRAKRDLGELLDRASHHPDNRELIESHLASHDVPFEAVETTHTFYSELLEWLDSYIHRELAARVEGYDHAGVAALPDETVEIELRDPETTERDEFTEWAETAGYDGSFFRTLPTVGSAVEDALAQQGIDRDCVCTAVGGRFTQWWQRDHTEFFREITLEPTDVDRRSPPSPWLNQYNASLLMYNCFPGGRVSEHLSELGGGILMSATLEPLSVFEAVSGLQSLSAAADGGSEAAAAQPASDDTAAATATPASDDTAAATETPASDDTEAAATTASDDRRNRHIERRSYELQFPAENRESWLVDVMPFTARNRGDPASENKTRKRYAYVAREIARSHGNILLCYPNYREAAWAAERLRDEVAKPIYLDESSSHETTRALRQEFVSDDHAVLVTSTRGTLTEGVDYEGAALHTCAVFGIPLVNIGSPRVQAVRNAYGDRFGESNAFEYALTVPAIRRVRQAMGRVIRGPEERGVRILVGERYLPHKPRSVASLFPPQEQQEFRQLTPEFLDDQFTQFWD